MDIFLYDNSLKNFIKLPVVPLDLEVSSPQEVETFRSIGQGELKIIGDKGSRSFSLETFFPVHDYPFLKDRTYKGMQYVDIIEKWRESKLPLTVIVSSLNINFQCAIEDFEYGVQDGSGDIYYTLDLVESKPPNIKKVSPNKSTVPPKKGQTTPPKKAEYLENAYGVVNVKTTLNVRSGAGMNYKRIGSLKSKAKVYRLNGSWWQIQYGKGMGYVSSKYIRRV